MLLILILTVSLFQETQPSIASNTVHEYAGQNQGGQRKNEARDKAQAPASASVQQPARQPAKEESYNPQKDTLYRLYLIATIVGVVIALVGIAFIYRQTSHIAAQTKYLAAQNDIQQKTSRQWVHLEGWRQNIFSDNTLEIPFNIINPTPLPIFLDCVTSRADTTGSTTAIGTFLIPNHPYGLQVGALLNAERRQLYETTKLVLNIEVSIFFADCFDNKWEQKYTALFLCGRNQHHLSIQETRTTMNRIPQ